MTHDPLHNLLQRADIAAGLPSVPNRLADDVLRAARRRTLTTVARTIAVGLVVALALGLWLRPAAPAGSPSQVAKSVSADGALRTETASLHDELSQLQAELRLQTMVVNRLLELERQRQARDRLRAALGEPDPIDTVRRQREQAAVTMLWNADREDREGSRHESARHEYQRLIDLFGETAAAEAARNRLHRLTPNQGDSL